LLLLVQTVALLVGFLARFQAACVFVWLVSFYHRNQLIFDGEDTVFRLFCFYLILLPIGDHYAVDSWWKRRRSGSSEQPPVHPIWPLRLVQIQWTLIYLSSAMEKFNGPEWLDGTALYYVSRLDDMFGKFPVPAVLFDSMIAIKLMTWSVLTLETLVPIGLWIKPTRTAAVMLAAAFHLATDYTMNLFLFHWIMLVGLLSFIPSERRPD
jgi:hypothetical protein